MQINNPAARSIRLIVLLTLGIGLFWQGILILEVAALLALVALASGYRPTLSKHSGT